MSSHSLVFHWGGGARDIGAHGGDAIDSMGVAEWNNPTFVVVHVQ